jgi:tungstate transport system ATP-binding protein
MPDRLTPIDVTGLTLMSGGRCLLDGITCRIEAEGITAILGPNGAGKSLLLRCLHGLADPTSGAVTFGGRPGEASMRLQQSFVFQQPTLLRRTVIENMLFVSRQRGIAEADVQSWLEKVGLTALAHQPARLLSGGEKQRLALARGLLTRPSILFLDEATSNLDPASVQMIEAITREVAASGTKVITITHDIGQARRLADQVLFLARGQLIEDGKAKSFFSKPRSEEARAYLEGRIIV